VYEDRNGYLYLVHARLDVSYLPPVCVSDMNQDGGVDGSDVTAFFGYWEAGEDAADLNVDGGVDFADVSFFFEHWEAGC
jgi:O-acetyl-ADP-ribose deacetylase (regulator of RNase III)